MDKAKLLDKPFIVVTSDEHKKSFIQDCQKIYDITGKNGRTFCGIDFEFNMNWKLKTRYIGSMQIIFIFDGEKYHDKTFIKPIYVIDPSKLSHLDKELFIKYIIKSKVIKIFHGSDSLDYPYIFNDLLKNDKHKFIEFINSSVDTRFLCEISKRIKSRIGVDVPSNKCSIYNALYDNDAINKETFNELTKIGDKINYNKRWKVELLTYDQVIYSVYDVVYLYDLLEKISNQIDICTKTADPDMAYKPGSVDCIDLVSMINRVYRYHMLNRLEITNISSQCDVIFNSYKLTKDLISQLDQQIMETPLTSIEFKKSTKESINVLITLEDILTMDVIRKNLLKFLRPYQYIANSGKNLNDVTKLDKIFESSEEFRIFKGRDYIIKLINVIKKKIGQHKPDVICK
jgi:hypothetical protein